MSTGRDQGPLTAASPPQTAGRGLPPSPDQAVRPAGSHQAAAQTNAGVAVFWILINNRCVMMVLSMFTVSGTQKGDFFPPILIMKP